MEYYVILTIVIPKDKISPKSERGGGGPGLTMDIQIPDNCRALHKYFAAGWRGKPRELLCFKTGKVTMADTRRSQVKGD